MLGPWGGFRMILAVLQTPWKSSTYLYLLGYGSLPSMKSRQILPLWSAIESEEPKARYFRGCQCFSEPCPFKPTNAPFGHVRMDERHFEERRKGRMTLHCLESCQWPSQPSVLWHCFASNGVQGPQLGQCVKSDEPGV